MTRDGDGLANTFVDADDADANVKLGTHNGLSLTAANLRILTGSFAFSDQFDTAGASADSPTGIAATATSVWMVDIAAGTLRVRVQPHWHPATSV